MRHNNGMEGTVKLESALWNQVEHGLRASDLPWHVNFNECTVTFDAFDLAWCVLVAFDRTTETMPESVFPILTGILGTIEPEFMGEVRGVLFSHYHRHIGDKNTQDAMDAFLTV